MIQIRVSRAMLERVDQAAKSSLTSRSGYIRDCIARQLNNQRVVIEPSEEDFYKYLEERAAKEEAEYAAKYRDDDPEGLFAP